MSSSAHFSAATKCMHLQLRFPAFRRRSSSPSNRTLLLEQPLRPHESALFREAADGNASIYAIFGGQGNIEEYFEELREVYNTYPSFVEDFITASASHLLQLSRDPRAVKLYSKGLDVMRWLQNHDAQPDTDYLVSAPV